MFEAEASLSFKYEKKHGGSISQTDASEHLVGSDFRTWNRNADFFQFEFVFVLLETKD